MCSFRLGATISSLGPHHALVLLTWSCTNVSSARLPAWCGVQCRSMVTVICNDLSLDEDEFVFFREPTRRMRVSNTPVDLLPSLPNYNRRVANYISEMNSSILSCPSNQLALRTPGVMIWTKNDGARRWALKFLKELRFQPYHVAELMHFWMERLLAYALGGELARLGWKQMGKYYVSASNAVMFSFTCQYRTVSLHFSAFAAQSHEMLSPRCGIWCRTLPNMSDCKIVDTNATMVAPFDTPAKMQHFWKHMYGYSLTPSEAGQCVCVTFGSTPMVYVYPRCCLQAYPLRTRRLLREDDAFQRILAYVRNCTLFKSLGMKFDFTQDQNLKLRSAMEAHECAELENETDTAPAVPDVSKYSK